MSSSEVVTFHDHLQTLLAGTENATPRPIVILGAKMPDDHWAQHIRFSRDIAETLLERRGINNPNLGHTALMFYDSTQESITVKLPDEGVKDLIVDSNTYIITNAMVGYGSPARYAPLIVMDVAEKTLEDLNFDFRHELSHLGDKADIEYAYRRNTSRSSVQTLGIAAVTTGLSLVGNTINEAFHSHELQPIPVSLGLVGAACAYAGFQLFRKAPELLHKFHPAELKANRFARQNGDLNPIFISE